jgi:GDP-L-fucose synthase
MTSVEVGAGTPDASSGLRIGDRIYVAGHTGMVGSAIVRRLRALGHEDILTASRAELDLTDQAAVRAYFASNRIDQVVLAAARVGGIHANQAFPADFLLENLLIEAHVMQAAHASGVPRLLFLGSSCIYPRLASQPMREDALLTGPLEPTNAPYAIAKIAGITLCAALRRQHGRDYRSVMPTNLYGPGDNFHPTQAHVIPALLRRFDEAARAGAPAVQVWGSGEARREFLHVDDLADACVFVMQLDGNAWLACADPRHGHVNVGTGVECSIRELATEIARITGFRGQLVFDAARPDGAPRKLLDTSRLAALGWTASTELSHGLEDTWRWFRAHRESARG